MLTGKQKRYLRALAVGIEPIFQVGKGGLSTNLFRQLDDALEARELIKVRVLSNSDLTPQDAAVEIGTWTKSEVVQVIGRNMVFFRQSQKKPVLELP